MDDDIAISVYPPDGDCSEFFDWEHWQHDAQLEAGPSQLFPPSYQYDVDQTPIPDTNIEPLSTVEWMYQLPFAQIPYPPVPMNNLDPFGVFNTQMLLSDAVSSSGSSTIPNPNSAVSSNSTVDTDLRLRPPPQRQRSSSLSVIRPVNVPVRRPRGSTVTEPSAVKIEEFDTTWTSTHHVNIPNGNMAPSLPLRSPKSAQRSPSPYQRPVGRDRSGSDLSIQSNWSSITSSSFGSSFPPPSPSVSVTSCDTREGSPFKDVVATEAIKAAGLAARKRKANFQCEMCLSTFTAKQRLNTHMNSHFNIRRFECTACDQRFGQLCDLKRHEKSEKHKAAVRKR